MVTEPESAHSKPTTFIYAPLAKQNQCDDATAFLASISICAAALMPELIDAARSD